VGTIYYARQHTMLYRVYMLRQFSLSVYLYVTRVDCIKTAERIIEILSLSGMFGLYVGEKKTMTIKMTPRRRFYTIPQCE